MLSKLARTHENSNEALKSYWTLITRNLEVQVKINIASNSLTVDTRFLMPSFPPEPIDTFIQSSRIVNLRGPVSDLLWLQMDTVSSSYAPRLAQREAQPGLVDSCLANLNSGSSSQAALTGQRPASLQPS